MSKPKQATRRDLIQALGVFFRHWLATLDDSELTTVMLQWKEAVDNADEPVAPCLERDMTAEDIYGYSEN